MNFDGSGSFDLDDEPITYAWNFGDGATSTAAKPSHQYTTAGVFTATLTVKDQLGATGAATLTINTRNNPPVLTVTGPPAGTTFARRHAGQHHRFRHRRRGRHHPAVGPDLPN